MPKPTALILGASGKIGSYLLQALLPDHRAGRLKLVAGFRRPEVGEALREQGANVRLIDLDRAEIEGLAPLVASLDGVDRVFLAIPV